MSEVDHYQGYPSAPLSPLPHQEAMAAENVSLRLLLARAEIDALDLLAQAGIDAKDMRPQTV